MKILSLLCILFALESSYARELGLIYKNNQAVTLFKKEKRLEAFETFMGLTAKDPSDVILKFNVASSLQALGEEEKSIQLNSAILSDIVRLMKTATDAEQMELQKIRFATLYNNGVSYQILQNVDQALKNYQQALEVIPSSKEIKINIEMLFSSGGGKGKGDDKNKEQKQEGEGDGESEPKDSEEQKDKEKNKDQKKEQQQQKPKEFDPKYMSQEDLKRIMEELRDQEQKIRAKMERKGEKSAPKDKEW